MVRFLWFLALMFLLVPGTEGQVFAGEKIRMVTTSSVLAAITHEITGDLADIHYVVPPRQNIHFVAPTPKDVLKTKKADVFIREGLDLESWCDPLLNAAGNPKFFGNGKALIDASNGISLVEVPASLSRTEGDIHQFGNPHYWLDPANGGQIADTVTNGLRALYPEHADRFKTRADQFKKRLGEKLKSWESEMAPYRGTAVVTYHRSWPYFLARFGLVTLGELEPKPGIPPTAKHLAGLIQSMKEKKAAVVIKEPYQESRAPEKVARETGARVVTLSQMVGEPKEASDYIALFDHNIAAIKTALEKK